MPRQTENRSIADEQSNSRPLYPFDAGLWHERQMHWYRSSGAARTLLKEQGIPYSLVTESAMQNFVAGQASLHRESANLLRILQKQGVLEKLVRKSTQAFRETDNRKRNRHRAH